MVEDHDLEAGFVEVAVMDVVWTGFEGVEGDAGPNAE